LAAAPFLFLRFLPLPAALGASSTCSAGASSEVPFAAASTDCLAGEADSSTTAAAGTSSVTVSVTGPSAAALGEPAGRSQPDAQVHKSKAPQECNARHHERTCVSHSALRLLFW
jgi:hypothetical protein